MLFCQLYLFQESYVDHALILLRLSPTTLVDVDESSVVAVLLTAIEKSDERVASKYLLLLSSLLSFTVSSRSLRLLMHYLLSSNGIWVHPYPSYSFTSAPTPMSSFIN